MYAFRLNAVELKQNMMPHYTPSSVEQSECSDASPFKQIRI